MKDVVERQKPDESHLNAIIDVKPTKSVHPVRAIDSIDEQLERLADVIIEQLLKDLG
ncbi:MAG: hypothetical protein JNN00_18105 [Chitinophagaceae bacterium]|nr:hypothetical protein [Chitinophagaceae bacterium]